MSDSEGWSPACGHCAKSLPEQSDSYQSPTCTTCRFHVHEECLDDCNERLESGPGGDDGWHLACGHCGEKLTPQTPGKESPTCASCNFHIHLGCIDDCGEEPTFHPLESDRRIVTSSQQAKTSEKTSLDQLYRIDKYKPLNEPYRKLLDGLGCVFIGDLGYLRLSCGDGLAWLNPYTGNQHNRCVFVQLALAALWRDSTNSGYHGHLMEAFLGSGQVFLNFNWCGGLFGTTAPSVIAGDLNVCLCSAWMGLTGQLGDGSSPFLAGYINRALRLDVLLARAIGRNKKEREEARKALYDSLRQRLNVLLASGGELTDSLLDSYSQETLAEIAHLYIYLNNRCANQTTYNLGTRTFSASLDQAKCDRLTQIRTDEWNALCRVAQLLSGASLDVARADFALTTGQAGMGDVVVYDCPFPEFSIKIPPTLEEDFKVVVEGKLMGWSTDVGEALLQCSGRGRMRGGNRYGANDGEGLQIRILEDAVRRQRAGASILICNYATPTLLVWYSKLSYALYGQLLPIFLFKRPQKGEELYFIAIWPSQAVLRKCGEGSMTYLTRRILGVYRLISQKMAAKSSLSQQEIKLIIEQGWT